MDAAQLDVIVADGSLGSLAAGYLLAAQGRTVGVVDRPAETGTTTVSVAAARRVQPLRDLVVRAPVVARRSAVVLLPEGSLAVAVDSDRFRDAGTAVAVVDREAVAMALLGCTVDLGGRVLPDGCAPYLHASGAVAGVTDGDGRELSARCTLVSREDVDRLLGVPEASPRVPSWAVETEWAFTLDAGAVSARFSLPSGGAAERWLYGDPFDAGDGFGRLRAFRDTVTLAVVLPLAQVLERRLSVDDLGRRLRSHPTIAPLLEGAVEVGTSGRTLPTAHPDVASMVGDGWVATPTALPADPAPLSTEMLMAEEIAGSVDLALASHRVTAARLAMLPGRLVRVAGSTPRFPLQPIDGWADELVVDPARLVEAARLLAERFGSAR